MKLEKINTLQKCKVFPSLGVRKLHRLTFMDPKLSYNLTLKTCYMNLPNQLGDHKVYRGNNWTPDGSKTHVHCPGGCGERERKTSRRATLRVQSKPQGTYFVRSVAQKKYKKQENLPPPGIKCHMLYFQKNNCKNLMTVNN